MGTEMETSSASAGFVESISQLALRNELIAEKILGFCPLDTLKTMRQVSQFYRLEAMKEMFRKYYLPLHFCSLHHPLSGTLERFLHDHVDRVKFRNIKTLGTNFCACFYFDEEEENFRYERRFEHFCPHITLYGQHVRELIVNVQLYYNQVPQLCTDLSNLPNLKSMTLPTLLLNPSDKLWPSIFRVIQQLDVLNVRRLSPAALLHFIQLKKDAPISVQKLFPGIAHWSLEVKNGRVPAGSLVGGRDNEIEENLIVARSYHPRGDLLPGKLVPSHGVNYAPWSTTAHELSKYETLLLKDDEVQWVASSNGEGVLGAVIGGMTDYGEPLYIGRTVHNNSIHLGKIHRSHRVLYIAYQGEELAFPNYEALVLKSALTN